MTGLTADDAVGRALWQRAWRDTRSRFVIGLVLLVISTIGVVMSYPRVVRMAPAATSDIGGEIGRQIRESFELARSYHGYIWSQWFRQNMSQTLVLFAVLLGTGGLLARVSRGGALFTLSLPVSRERLMLIRAITGLAEILALAIIPALLVPVLSPAIAERYSFVDAVVYGICQFAGASVVFSFTFVLSTVFTDVWRPGLIAVCTAAVVNLCEPFIPGLRGHGLFGVMHGEIYFRGGAIPWIGLLATFAISAVMIRLATRNIVRQDF